MAENQRQNKKQDNVDDEMLPNKGQPVQQRDTGGNRPDTAGEHGRMAPETAKKLGEDAQRET